MATFVLVPGYWLTASSWDAVSAGLTRAGHEVRALTLPGTESRDADRSHIRLADHVATLADAVTAATEPVVIVGSSFSGTLAQIVTELHPESVALTVYVDALPQQLDPAGSGDPQGDEIAFSWDELTAREQEDLSDELRAEIESIAVPFPAQVVRDGWDLSAGRRHAVPALVVATGFDEDQLTEWRASYPEVAEELDAHDDLTIAWLPTSHWPQLTRPDDLVEILLDAI
jgi:pimeloyl-ACP methyl ester carboxylesterase